jgi:exonuclease III
MSIITLSINGLNYLIKRYKLAEWKNHDPSIYCLQETDFTRKDRLKIKEWKKMLHTNVNQKWSGITITKSDKVDLKTKNVRDKKSHYLMIKGSIQQKYKNYKSICTQCWNIQFNTPNTIRSKRTERI